jgi:O-6-methylguanine DNA methyltransferase
VSDEKTVEFTRFSSPLGTLGMAARGGKIIYLGMGGSCQEDMFLWLEKKLPGVPVAGRDDPAGVMAMAAGQVLQFLEGKRRVFELPIDPMGTDFQLRVWKALSRIPWGHTRTYGEVAVEIGNSRGARAVGGACNRNPLPLIIPCHRVVGTGGRMVGFGCGINVKERLLEMERG